MPLAAASAARVQLHAARLRSGVRSRASVRVAAVLADAPAPKSAPEVKAPAIDAKGFLEPEMQGVAQAIYDAGAEYGCFQLVNHGVSLDLIARMQAAQRDFFALPLDTKAQVKRSMSNPNGWFDDEYTKRTLDLKECFDFFNEKSVAAADPTVHRVIAARNQWPAGQPLFRDVMETYFGEMSRVSFKLLEAFCSALDIPLDSMHGLFDETHTSFMRLNFYPPQRPGERRMALNHHTDAGFFTLLIQDPEVHGLQFHKHGQWNDVTPELDAITVNVGDQCQVISNDVFKAPVHRVLPPQSGRARHSAPFFFNPKPDAMVQPHPAFVTPDRPPVYNAIPWAKFRNQRYAGDFADEGEEVQIYHYKR
ncbi:2OG-Fe(II) oxygenase superfamily [Chlorella sorokiniana]|uniref:2OG-Fe(II) oxygenase superfamily n=1 Tax=Chlorella sorokiniana TaxID=3076 RepID=A0A2P6TWG8_CHLSO|nr:2OG-Fe(II) oxygenase superfamily [Chlorella sorokiniana]|eukprot:PRW58404.1 2OG-Fe(II) oxygenase superfamily [Chlorella sorokiniana]